MFANQKDFTKFIKLFPYLNQDVMNNLIDFLSKAEKKSVTRYIEIHIDSQKEKEKKIDEAKAKVKK